MDSTVKVTKNEVPDHPKRVWGIAQVLAVKIAPIWFCTLIIYIVF
jgi:hypothetical protein